MRPRPLSTTAAFDAPLISDAELERLRLITLQLRGRSRAPQADGHGGQRLTRWRGQGMELHDVRPYQPGDDIRRIDWRATARSGRPLSRVFLEERARSLFLLVDRRPSMLFGTRNELKAATAARVAAILAFSALAAREPVSALVVGDDAQYFPPAANLAAVIRILQAAAAPATDPGRRRDALASSRLADGLRQVGHQLERGACCCLISDFHDLADGRAQAADYLPRDCDPAHHDKVAIRILDPAETRLPAAGWLPLVSPDRATTTLVDTSDPQLARRYAARISERAAALRDRCAAADIRLLTIDHETTLFAQLESLL